MPIKSTRKENKKKNDIGSLPAIGVYKNNGMIGLISDLDGEYCVTVIGNPNLTFPFGWHGTVNLSNWELYDGSITLENN